MLEALAPTHNNLLTGIPTLELGSRAPLYVFSDRLAQRSNPAKQHTTFSIPGRPDNQVRSDMALNHAGVAGCAPAAARGAPILAPYFWQLCTFFAGITTFSVSFGAGEDRFEAEMHLHFMKRALRAKSI